MAQDFQVPDNFNPLYNNNFHFEILSLPTVSGMAQKFNMPGIRLGTAQQMTGNVDVTRPGDKLQFEELEIQFLVDEGLQNFMEVFHWMVYLAFPRHSKQFYEMYRGNTRYTETSDIILTTTTNKKNPNSRIHFVDAFPTSLTPVEFSNVDTTSQPVIASAMFGYAYYYFEGVDSTMGEGFLRVDKPNE